MTKNIIFIQELAGGWQLYGKTGLAFQKDKDGNITDIQNGWFVGWIEKDGRVIPLQAILWMKYIKMFL